MTIERRRIAASGGAPAVTVLELGVAEATPRLVVLGGVHGDEPQGPAGARALADRLGETDLSGSVRIVPICHEVAFRGASRASPIDGLNLARVFPGHADGSATEQLAALLDTRVLADIDILIDLHSAGLHFAMPSLVGYADDGGDAAVEAARLAEAAAMPVIWSHPGPLAPGRTGTAPQARGVPFLYFESTDDRDESGAYADAVLRVMAAAGMIEDAPRPALAPPRRLVGPGDLDVGGVLADRSGLIDVVVELLEPVEAGATVAHIRDPRDGDTAPLVATTDGVIVMRRRTRWVAEGDLVAFVTGDPGADR